MRLTVKDLKKSLEGLDDNVRIVIDTEARTFNVHLTSVDSIYTENINGEDILILYPNYQGTTFCKGECK